MDEIMPARVDEMVIRRIGMLAQKLGTPKKKILENAVRRYAEKVASEEEFDLPDPTLGAWRRKESAADVVEDIRTVMRKSQESYKR